MIWIKLKIKKNQDKRRKNPKTNVNSLILCFVLQAFNSFDEKLQNYLFHFCGSFMPREAACELGFLSEENFEAEFEDFFSIIIYRYFRFNLQSRRLITS